MKVKPSVIKVADVETIENIVQHGLECKILGRPYFIVLPETDTTKSRLMILDITEIDNTPTEFMKASGNAGLDIAQALVIIYGSEKIASDIMKSYDKTVERLPSDITNKVNKTKINPSLDHALNSGTGVYKP